MLMPAWSYFINKNNIKRYTVFDIYGCYHSFGFKTLFDTHFQTNQTDIYTVAVYTRALETVLFLFLFCWLCRKTYSMLACLLNTISFSLSLSHSHSFLFYLSLWTYVYIYILLFLFLCFNFEQNCRRIFNWISFNPGEKKKIYEECKMRWRENSKCDIKTFQAGSDITNIRF